MTPRRPAAPPTIRFVRGDIVAEVAGGRYGAVVNAANSMLLDGAGVAGAIFAAADTGLADACRAHTDAHGPVAPGEAVATGGHGIGVDVIVHAVGPRHGIDEPAAELLAAANRRAVEVADAHGCEHLAMPALSTGVYGYPVAEAAPVAVRAVRNALERCTTLHEVTFVLYDADTEAAYRAAGEADGVA